MVPGGVVAGGHRVVDGVGEHVVSWKKSWAFQLAGDPAVLESSWTHPKAIFLGTRRVGRKGGAREIRSPRVVVLVGVACAEVHGVARALLPHSPTHTHTVRQTTVGVGTLVGLGAPRTARGSVYYWVGGDGDCEDGVALCMFSKGVLRPCGRSSTFGISKSI